MHWSEMFGWSSLFLAVDIAISVAILCFCDWLWEWCGRKKQLSYKGHPIKWSEPNDPNSWWSDRASDVVSVSTLNSLRKMWDDCSSSGTGCVRIDPTALIKGRHMDTMIEDDFVERKEANEAAGKAYDETFGKVYIRDEGQEEELCLCSKSLWK